MVGICMDPGGAARAGAAITIDGGEARIRLAAHFDDVQAASDANPGRQTGAALVPFASARRDEILASLEEIENIGNKIVETIRSRMEVDESYATSLSKVEKAMGVMSE